MPQRLRIGVDARPLSIPATGIGRYCRELLCRLIDSPHEWFLYSNSPILEALPVAKNLSIRHGKVSRRLLSTPYAQAVFPVWARRDQLDLFWSPRHHLPIGLPPAMKKVLTIHDLVWMEYPETMSRFGRLLERALTPRSIRGSAQIICPSLSTARDVALRFDVPPQRLQTIPLAGFIESADVQHLSSSPLKEQKPYILCVGTLEPRKNLKYSLQAFANLVHQGACQHQLCLIGAKGWGEDIKQLVRDLRLEERVSVLGRLSDSELCQWYAHADIFLMPSLYEGFGLPLLEAMGFGVPVITSNSSSMPEVAGEGGLLVNPQSVADIQRAIATLCSDTQLRSALSVKARKIAGLYSWDKTAEQTLSVLESV